MIDTFNVKEPISKTMQVFVLEHETKEEIRQLLEKELSKVFYGNELDEYVELGMDSRLCDLEEVINLNDIKSIVVI